MAASYVIHRPAVVAMLDAGIEIFRFRLGRISIEHLGGLFFMATLGCPAGSDRNDR